MNQSLEEILSEWLTDTLNILICTESANVASTIMSYVGRYASFKLHRVSNEKVLDLYMKQGITWHCIIIDNELSFSRRVYNYISKFNHWVPIVLMSNNVPENLWNEWIYEKISNEKVSFHNGESRIEGATIELLDKRRINDFVPVILSNSLKKQFFKEVPDIEIEKILKMLYLNNPDSVKEWAKINCISNRKIQRMLKSFCRITPKKVLSLYHAYRIALSEVDNSGNLNCEIFAIHELKRSLKIRYMEYCLSRRSVLFNI